MKSKSNSIRLISLVLFSVLIIVPSSGCSKRYDDMPAFSAIPLGDAFNYSVGRFKTSYLADQIHAYYRGHISGPIGVATFVDLDNLYTSSTFGRILAEQLMTELAMKGYTVIEIRKADAIQIMSLQGEFALSRETASMRRFQDMAGIVVGTYAESPERVYVNARILDPTTAVIVSAGSVEMGKSEEIARLIRSNSVAPTLERIPVRNLGYASFPVPYYYPGPLQFGRPGGEEDAGSNGLVPGSGAPGNLDLPPPAPALAPPPPSSGNTLDADRTSEISYCFHAITAPG